MTSGSFSPQAPLQFGFPPRPFPPEGAGAPTEDGHLDGSGRVLVVEDEYLVAALAEEILTEAGYSVSVAGTALEAMEIAEAERPDLVLMDIHLGPGLSGIDAAREILKKTGIRCIFATAHVDQTTRASAAPARPLGWLPKPYSDRDLVRAVRGVLDPPTG